MKKLFIITGTLIMAITLAACGNNDDTNNSTDNTTNTEQNNTGNNQMNATENNDDGNSATADDSDSDNDSDESGSGNTGDNDDMLKKMDDLNYNEFEVEVSYAKNKEYEAKIEHDNGRVSADLEDELNGEDLKGQEAFDKIYPNVKKLTIDQSTSKEDAIKQILDAFDLEDDYEKFETEITFKDNTKIEFEDKK